MPIYEYICSECGKAFEELVRSIHGKPTVPCPGCGSTRVARTPSVFAVPESAPTPAGPPAGCGRCGDPNGPCSM